MARTSRRAGRVSSILATAVACGLVVHCGRTPVVATNDAGVAPDDAGVAPNDADSSLAIDADSASTKCTGENDGTPCGQDQTCHAGVCGPCIPGLLCNPNGNVCQKGATSCSTGAPTCVALGFANDGTECGTNQVCLNGVCVACTEGAPCQPNGNVCLAGTIACSTGQPACVSTGDSPDGTSCDAGICCGGACAACPPSTNQVLSCAGPTCTLGCTGGQTLCGSGCVDTTSDSTACGPWCTPCPAGSLCKDSKCSLVEYGDYTPFQPCNSSPTGVIRAGFLLGESVQIAAPITVTSLGVVGNPHAGGFNGIVALYSDYGGAPGGLVANTAATLIQAGSNEIPVISPTQVPAGAYWIMAEYSGDPEICDDTATGNKIDYFPVTYGALPNVFPNANSNAGPNLNYFVVGAP